MGEEIDLLDHYPQSKRPLDERAATVTDGQRSTARQFGQEYFDGSRLTGYGGYHYHPRFWTDTVRRFRDHYGLTPDAAVLDVGCAKGFMIYDFLQLMPQLRIQGLDLSEYALEHAKEEVRDRLTLGSADELPFEDDAFDLVISINTIHNLPLENCKDALREIERVSRGDSFVVVDAWRNEREREALLKWNLTAQTFMSTEAWKALFAEVGYSGDYWWFIASGG